MPVTRLIVLNGNAGAFIDVLSTIPVTRYSAMEDEAAATTGLQVKGPFDAFANVHTFSFGSEPIKFPDDIEASARVGSLRGLPAQGQVGAFNARSADKLMSARSNAAGATTIRFIEME